MDLEATSKINNQVLPAEGVEPPRLEDYVDLESQDSTHFVPNRLQTILTLHWLTQHYESVEGVSLPRCLIYKHYSDYCQKNQFHPVNAASFGKVIRQVFPELRTRRLGTRGQSKYHYYGIRVKESSPYFGVFLDSQRVTEPTLYRTCGFPILSTKSQWEQAMVPDQSDNQQVSMTSMLTLLPEFPTAAQTQPWEDIEFEQVDAVISQYRYHCQKIIENIMRGRLEEVPIAVQQFWQGLPDATRLVLEGRSSDKLADLIALCDNILYQTMINILIPGTVQQLPPSLLHAIRHFSCGFQRVVEESLPTLSEYLHRKRVETVKRFCQLLKRKTSLSHLAQATRAVLKTKMTVTQMSHDWRKRTEQNTVCSQLMWTVPSSSANIKTVAKKCFSEFSRLLEKHASVEEHIKWLHSVRSKCLINSEDGDCISKEETERDFLLQWSYVCNLLIRDQTLRSATSFGSFHLLHLLYEEYLLYMVDAQRNQIQERALWKRLFDTDTEVPSYFLTSANGSEVDEPKRLPDAPFVIPEQLYQLGPNCTISTGHNSPSVNSATGVNRGVNPYYFNPYAASSERIYVKPPVSSAAGSPYQSPTLGGETSKNGVAFTMPSKSTAVPASSMPSKSLQGYFASSPVFPTQNQSISPKTHQVKKEKDVSGLSLSGGPGIVTIPINGPVTYLQTSPSRGGQASSVTVLPSGYRMSPSPHAPAAPSRVVTQQQQPVGVTAQVQTSSSSSREPPPLQPISHGHLQSTGSQYSPITVPEYQQKPQQKLLATKIIKAVPVSSESKQKPVSFQFSITTSQKLNLSKGQILTTTNGERYLINEVQTTSQQTESTRESSN